MTKTEMKRSGHVYFILSVAVIVIVGVKLVLVDIDYAYKFVIVLGIGVISMLISFTKPWKKRFEREVN